MVSTPRKNATRRNIRQVPGMPDSAFQALLAANPILNFHQATLYAGRSDRTLRRAIDAGDLSHMRDGESGYILFRKSMLDEWMARHEIPARPKADIVAG